MHRREAIRRLAIWVGGSLSAPALAALHACRNAPAGSQFLSVRQFEMIGAAVDLIIPPSDTPGARDVGVPGFVDHMLAAWLPEADRRLLVEGLAALDRTAESRHGNDFLGCAEAERYDLVNELDEAAYAERNGAPFFRLLKELTLVGYYTSEPGATEELHQQPLGAYRGDVSLAEVGKAWA